MQATLTRRISAADGKLEVRGDWIGKKTGLGVKSRILVGNQQSSNRHRKVLAFPLALWQLGTSERIMGRIFFCFMVCL